jgi:hypothetical protein
MSVFTPVPFSFIQTIAAAGAAYPVATGGTITTSGSYKIHTFTSNEDFTITNAVTSFPFEYLLVGAGGNGGSGASGVPFGDGGGGAGGIVRTSTVNITTAGSTAYPVVVGVNAGSRTSTWNSISATGGNNGNNNAGSVGGTGGSNADYSGGSGAEPNGGGGAGAAGNGSSPGAGGAAYVSDITGTSTNYGRGGPGDNSAGGGIGFGGGVNIFGGAGQNGSDGIVIIKYQFQA